MRRLKNKDEDGIIAAFVVLLMLVLLGVAGLVVDFGIVRAEKRELQNGADAAALALAQDCAMNLLCINFAKAKTYADANATDNAASVTDVTNPSSQTVKVDTRTETSGGATSLATKFAYLVGGPASATVTATATAGWGAPSAAQTIPLTISYCEWNTLTGGGNTFGVPQTIYFHDPKGNQNVATPCSGGPAGQNLPGGFGWLDPISNSVCGTDITAGGWFGSAPGNSPPNTNNSGCTPALFMNGPILIPVFQAVTGQGQNGQYRIYGLATFQITRMRLGGNGSQWTTNPPPPNCTSSQRCIYGSFLQDIIPWTGGPVGVPGPNLGTLSVFLTA